MALKKKKKALKITEHCSGNKGQLLADFRLFEAVLEPPPWGKARNECTEFRIIVTPTATSPKVLPPLPVVRHSAIFNLCHVCQTFEYQPCALIIQA